MKINRDKIIDWHTFSGLNFFSDELTFGKVVVGPSDTVPGLYAIPSVQTFENLNKLKNRCAKPYLLLIRDLTAIANYADLNQLAPYDKLIRACWPGPLTIILKAKADAPAWIVSAQGTIAIRIPSHPQLSQVLERVPMLFSTSANLAGQPTPVHVADVDQSIVDGVDWIVQDAVGGESGKMPVPSTLIDISSGSLVMVREGAYSREFVEKFIHF